MELVGSNEIPEPFLSGVKKIDVSGSIELTLTGSLEVMKLYHADRCTELRAISILETTSIPCLWSVYKEIQKTV